MKKPEKTVPVNADSIRRSLQAIGMTQAEASRIMGLTDNYLSASLSIGKLPESVVERLAIFLRVPADTLLPVEERKPEKPSGGVTLPDDMAKESTLQALLYGLSQLTKAVNELADTVAVMKSNEKNYYAATAKWQERMFNQIKYRPKE